MKGRNVKLTIKVGAGVSAVLLLVAVIYLLVASIEAWTVPADDWGVMDQGHDVAAFMAALVASVAVLLGFAVLRIGEFVAGRRSTTWTKRAVPMVVALIALIWAASIIGENIQKIWPHSGDGVAIGVASPFLVVGLIAMFRSLSPGRLYGGDPARALGAMALVGASILVVIVALPWIRDGIDLVLTPFWGYSDNDPAAYLIFGGIPAFVGLLLVWISAFLAGLATEVSVGPLKGGSTRRLLKQSSGLVLAIFSPVSLSIGIAISLADPAYSNATPLITPYAAVAFLLSFAFLTAAYLLIRPRTHLKSDSGARTSA